MRCNGEFGACMGVGGKTVICMEVSQGKRVKRVGQSGQGQASANGWALGEPMLALVVG